MAGYQNSGGTVIGVNGLNYGYPGNVSRAIDNIIVQRTINDTDSTNEVINFGSALVLNQNNTYSLFGQSAGTLATAIASAATVTTLAISAPGLTEPVQAGQTITVGFGTGTTQDFTVATTANSGATSVAVNSATASAAFAAGVAVVALNTASQFAGIAIREVKQAMDYYPQSGDYLPGQPCDALQRGSITVQCNNGTPYAGSPVYVRVATNTAIPNGVIGGFEATADGTNTVEIPLSVAKFKTGMVDSNGVTEITLLTRQFG